MPIPPLPWEEMRGPRMARDSATAQCVTSSHGLPAPTPPKVGRLGEYDIDVLVAWSATDFSSSEVTLSALLTSNPFGSISQDPDICTVRALSSTGSHDGPSAGLTAPGCLPFWHDPFFSGSPPRRLSAWRVQTTAKRPIFLSPVSTPVERKPHARKISPSGAGAQRRCLAFMPRGFPLSGAGAQRRCCALLMPPGASGSLQRELHGRVGPGLAEEGLPRPKPSRRFCKEHISRRRGYRCTRPQGRYVRRPGAPRPPPEREFRR